MPRIIRLISYESENAVDIERQLGKSMPDGCRVLLKEHNFS